MYSFLQRVPLVNQIVVLTETSGAIKRTGEAHLSAKLGSAPLWEW